MIFEWSNRRIRCAVEFRIYSTRRRYRCALAAFTRWWPSTNHAQQKDAYLAVTMRHHVKRGGERGWHLCRILCYRGRQLQTDLVHELRHATYWTVDHLRRKRRLRVYRRTRTRKAVDDEIAACLQGRLYQEIDRKLNRKKPLPYETFPSRYLKS